MGASQSNDPRPVLHYERLEKRRAPDGKYYTKKEFDSYYKEHSSHFWELEPHTAYKVDTPVYGVPFGGQEDEAAEQRIQTQLDALSPQINNDSNELEHIEETNEEPLPLSQSRDVMTGPPPVLLNISEELEEQLVCPITHEVMLDPWMDNEGNSYELSAILDHLSYSQTSPITRTPMAATTRHLRPNRILRDIIQLYTKPPPIPSTPTKN